MNYDTEDSSGSSDNQWHDFTILDQRTLLLKGHYSQTSSKYDDRNRGRQCAANAIMAIVYSRINPIKDWTQTTLNDILDEGDRLYDKSMECDDQTKIGPREVNSEFQTGNVNVMIQVGKIAKIAPPSVGRYFIDFFKTFTAGVITVSEKSYAIWKDDHSFYFFTPHATDDKGRRSKRGNSCALFRLADLTRLMEVIRQNVTTNQMYELVKVDILKVAKKEEEEKKTSCVMAQASSSHQRKRTQSIDLKCPRSNKLRNKRAPSLDMCAPRSELKEYEVIMEQQLSCSRQRKPPTLPKCPMTNQTMLDLTQPEFQRPIECMNVSTESSFEKSSDGTCDVVLGTMHIYLFEEALELTQAANIIAIVMLRFLGSVEWEAATLDDILETADQTYKYVANNRKKLSLSDYKNVIVLKCQQFRLKVKEIATAGRLSSREPNVQDLFPSLIDFFSLYDSGIIQGPISVAIWQEQSSYYMYDPFECDSNGRRVHNTIDNVGDACSRGASCLSRFKRIQDLADVYMDNLSQRHRKRNFIISCVEVMDQKGAPTPWHQWLGMNKGVWIIRADYSQASNKFRCDSQNRQCTCMAAIAIAYAQMVHMEDWTTEIMNNILQSGDEFYRKCVEHLKCTEQYKHPHLMVSELLPETVIFDMQIRFNTCDCLIYGLLTAHDDDVVPSLKTGLRMFFTENDSGIVTARSISVAVWRADEIYYYCDSHCRDHRGRSKDGGTACILRFLTIDSLATLLQSNFPSGSENMFNIGRVNAEIVPIHCEPNAFPMPSKFAEIKNDALPLYAILRSDIHEGWKGFDNRRNRQTICNIAQAMATAKVIKTSDWGPNVVESVLTDGDKMFDKILSDQDGGEDFEISVDSFNTPIKVGSNWLVMSKDCEINAVFHNGSDLKGDKSSNKNLNEMSLRDVLQSYFKCGCGEQDLKFTILISYVVTLALWKDDDGYFIFDPKACDRKGSMSRRRSLDAKNMMLEMIGALSCNTKTILEMGSDNEEDGSNYSACVLWFPSVDSMYKKILVNVPIECTEEMVVLVPIQMKNHLLPVKPQAKSQQGELMSPECSNVWNNFFEVENELYILRANISQSSHIFVEIPNRGNQDLTNAVAVMGYANCQNCSAWNTQLLDVMLRHGDSLYKRVHKRMSKMAEFVRNFDPWKNKLTAGALANLTISISNFKIKFEFIEDMVVGDINAKDDNPKILSIQKGLQKFFQQDEGVSMMITCKYYTVAFWKTDEDAFYMFDPHGCGPNGRLFANGTACCLRSICLQKLSEIYKNNVQKFMEDCDILDMSGSFSICEVRVWLDKAAAKDQRCVCPLAVLQDQKCKFDQGDGRRVNECGYGIIQGSMSLDSPNFQYTQPLPHLVAAIALAQIHDPLTWTKCEMDEILNAGNNLITETLNYSQCPIDPENMQLGDLNTEFTLRHNLVRYSVEETEAKGPAIVQSEHYFDLLMGLETFFMSYDFGVLITDDLKLALWRKPNMQKFVKMYFVYVPYSCGINGGIRPCGSSTLIMVPSTILVYKYIARNIHLQKECGGYAIYAINICISKFEDNADSGIASPELSLHNNALFQPVAMSSMLEPTIASPQPRAPSPVSRIPQLVTRSRQRLPRLTAETGQMFSEFYPLQPSYLESGKTTSPKCVPASAPISRIPMLQSRQGLACPNPEPQVSQICQMPSAACPPPPISKLPVSRSRQRVSRLTSQPGQMFSQFYPARSATKEYLSSTQSAACPPMAGSRIPLGRPRQIITGPSTESGCNLISPGTSLANVAPRFSQSVRRFRQRIPRIAKEPGAMFTQFIPMTTSPYSQTTQSNQFSPEVFSSISASKITTRKPRSGFVQQRAPMFPSFYPYEESSPDFNRPSGSAAPIMCEPPNLSMPQATETSFSKSYSSESLASSSQYDIMAPTCSIEETPVFQRDVPQPRRLFRKFCALGEKTSAMFPEFIKLPPSSQNYSPNQSTHYQQSNFQYTELPASRSTTQPDTTSMPMGMQTPSYNSQYDQKSPQICHMEETAYQYGVEQPKPICRSKYRQLGQTPSAMFPEFVKLPPPSPLQRTLSPSEACASQENFRSVPGGGEYLKANVSQRCGIPELEALPICVVALAMSISREPKTWSDIILKTILKAGEALYRDCTLFYGTVELNFDTLLRTFKIENKTVEIAVYEATYKGYVCKTEMKDALVNFFREEQTGVIFASGVHLALMQRAQLYYCLDANGTDGNIYLYRYSKTDHLASYILDKCLKCADPAATLGRFSIVPVRILN